MDLSEPARLARSLRHAGVTASIGRVMHRAGDLAAATHELDAAVEVLAVGGAESRVVVEVACELAGPARARDLALAFAGEQAIPFGEAELFDRAFELAPDANTFIALGDIAARKQRLDDAARAWDLALGAARALEGRNHGWKLRDLARSLLDHDADGRNAARIRQALDEALVVANGERSMTVALAPLFARAGDLDRARKLMRRIETPPARVAMLLEIARAEYRRDTSVPAAAYRALEEAITIVRGDAASTLEQLAEVSETCMTCGIASAALEFSLALAERTEEVTLDAPRFDGVGRLARLSQHFARINDGELAPIARDLRARAAARIDAARPALDLAAVDPYGGNAAIAMLELATAYVHAHEHATAADQLAGAVELVARPLVAPNVASMFAWRACYQLASWLSGGA